ncbi:MAG: LysM peptidoglycan-binding domain-containing protein, partial [Chloroflexi bacterium]|nr:LysM peptidoglycan-binding domain-containing protein [Chloroflexota bacterium]
MAKNVLTLFQIGRWVMVGVLLGTVLTGCFRDAGEGDAEPTQQQVNLQDIELNRTSAPSATRTPPVATFSPQTPTESGTLTIGGPPVEAAASATPKPTRTPESAEDAEDSTGDDAPPEASATATTTRTLVPTNTEVPPDVATVAPPGFGDTGISPTPSRTFTPSQEPNQPTPTDAAQQDECVYLVQGGDTLFSIARSFDLLPDDFYAVNPALQYNPDSLYIGQ